VSSKTQDTFVYLKFLNGDPSSVIAILLYLHIGTVLAAIIYFRREIIALFQAFMRRPLDYRAHANGEMGFLVAALIGTGIVGLPLLLMEKKLLPSLNGGLLFAVMGTGLLITGFLLLRQKGASMRKAGSVNWKDGIFTGLLQGLSILPGVSRAGTSTTGLIWRGFDSGSSFNLSFLLSIPTVVFAELLFYVTGSVASFPVADGALLALSSFVFGYLALDIILRLVKKVNLAYVVFVLGFVMIAAGLLGAG
jgi:undecaprenyl-diphosphatase